MTQPVARLQAPRPINRSASLIAFVATILGLLGCAEQMLKQQAQDQATSGQYQQAITTLEDATRRYPESAPLRSQLLQIRSEAIARRIAAAAQARDAGRVDASRAELEAAQALDPRNSRVEALLAEVVTQQRQDQAQKEAQARADARQFEAAQRLIEQALKDNPRHAGLLMLKRQVDAELRAAATRSPTGALAEQRPISLDFRDAPLRAVLDMVTRHSGVNFVLDRDIRTDTRVTVLLRDARVEDALDLLASANQLARKIVDRHTVLIYPNTPDKQREYQEQVVRVFYLANGDAKGAAAFLRAMLKVREPFVDERSHLLALRETPENVQLAERLVALFDAGEPEVLLEVEVLEINARRLTELGVKFPDTISLTPLAPNGASGLTVGNAADINRNFVGLGVAGLLINLKREVGDFSTLANPRIRARNREKARVMIGDKIPVVTTTTSGTGGFVSENVNYLDVGLKLDVEPLVYPDDEVAIRVALEVSSLGSSVRTNNGTLAYQIGTRNAATLLRLRDGETQLLAGLISRDERTSASRLPGLGDLPVLGRLFSSQQDQGSRTELMLAITPRILRNTRRPDASETELWVGTDAMPRLRVPRPAAVETGDTRPSAIVAPPSASASAPSIDAGPLAAAAAAAASVTANTATLRMSWRGPSSARTGDTVELELHQSAGASLRGLPLEVAFDRQRLQWLDIREGDAYNRDGGPTLFQHAVDAATGRLRVTAMRKTATAMNDGGRVFTLRFKAISPGEASVRTDNIQPIAMPGPAPDIVPANWTIAVQ